MESPKCSFASCELEVVGTAQIVSLSLSESEVLQLRYEIEMKYLCGVHYNDQFKKYVYWHNKKCADPCQRHARPRKTRLAVIELDTARPIQPSSRYVPLCVCLSKELSLLIRADRSETFYFFFLIK